MADNTNNNLTELKKKFKELYFLTNEEIATIVNKAAAAKTTEEGFKELFKLIAEAKQKQESFILEAVRNDPDFLPNLKRSLQGKYNEITTKLTAIEQGKSDEILSKLNNRPDDDEK